MKFTTYVSLLTFCLTTLNSAFAQSDGPSIRERLDRVNSCEELKIVAKDVKSLEVGASKMSIEIDETTKSLKDTRSTRDDFMKASAVLLAGSVGLMIAVKRMKGKIELNGYETWLSRQFNNGKIYSSTKSYAYGASQFWTTAFGIFFYTPTIVFMNNASELREKLETLQKKSNKLNFLIHSIKIEILEKANDYNGCKMSSK